MKTKKGNSFNGNDSHKLLVRNLIIVMRWWKQKVGGKQHIEKFSQITKHLSPWNNKDIVTLNKHHLQWQLIKGTMDICWAMNNKQNEPVTKHATKEA